MIKKVFVEPNGETSVFIYIPNFLSEEKAKKTHHWLNSKDYRQAVTHWNNASIREQLWIQKDHKYFCEDWSKRYYRWESGDYDDTLSSLQSQIQDSIDSLISKDKHIKRPLINSVLINRYRTNNDTIKPHRDTPSTFGEYPTITGLSIGETRKLKVKKLLYDKENPHSFIYDNTKSFLNFDIELENGSLFIMAGASQKYFSHEIPKEDRDCGERFSLTFREVI